MVRLKSPQRHKINVDINSNFNPPFIQLRDETLHVFLTNRAHIRNTFRSGVAFLRMAGQYPQLGHILRNIFGHSSAAIVPALRECQNKKIHA